VTGRGQSLRLTRRSLWALAVLVAAPLLPATETACGQAEHAPPTTAPVPIVIGVSLGLTGALGSFSAPLQNATRVAEGQINSLGGIFGRPVTFKIVDDTSDEGTIAQNVVSGLLSDGAVVILGPVGSSQVVATQKLAADKHVIMISPSATSPDLTTIQPSHDRYFFRTTPPDDLQGKAVALFALRGPPPAGLDGGIDAGTVGTAFCQKMAIVNIDNSYGNAMAKVIATFLAAHGGTITTSVVVPVKVADNYKSEVDQVIRSNPQCQALIAYDDVGDQYMVDLKSRITELAPEFIVIGTDGVYTSGFLTNGRANKADPASPTVAEGVYGTNADTNPPTGEFTDFKNLYGAYFPFAPGVDPDAYTANMYDAAILAVLAILQAGTLTDGVKIRDALYQVSKGGTAYGPAQIGDAIQAIRAGQDIDYKGASGNVDLDDNGNTISDYIVWKVVNGKFTDPPVDRIRASELLQ
jgi:ABC-type branched-subunit amino acid transport system substrate-binding protein